MAFELYAHGNISLKNLAQKLYDEGYIYTHMDGDIEKKYGQAKQMKLINKYYCYKIN